MKYIAIMLVAFATMATTAMAATGDTSSGSTSTGTTLSGSTSTGVTSTGIVLPTAPVCNGICGGGGPIRMWNYTKGSFDMWPQCFPQTFYSSFLKGSIMDIYINQEYCRAKRAIDFKR